MSMPDEIIDDFRILLDNYELAIRNGDAKEKKQVRLDLDNKVQEVEDEMMGYWESSMGEDL